MLIITRIFWLVDWAVIGVIIAIILLMLLRLVAESADLNPFSWSARTIRRLTDPFNLPVRRNLVGFGVDPKYAPLVVLLIAILLGWFALQIADAFRVTAAGVLLSITRTAPVAALGYVLYGLISIYILLVFMRIIFSWGMVSYSNRLMRFLINATEPLLGPLRRMIPPLGMLDISPIVAFLILYLFRAAVEGTLLRGAAGMM
jgi:YggT family protein